MRVERNVNIVAIGTFNPAIFQPEWFRSHEILPASEIDAAVDRPNSMMLTSDAAFISFKSLELQVLQNRFLLSTERPDWEEDLAGVVASVFKLLSHTPVTTLGFNVNEHRPVKAGTTTAALARWVPLTELGRLAGDKPRVMGVARGQWERYQVTLRVDESVRQVGALEVQQNFERKLTGGVRELVESLGRDWPQIRDRARQNAERLCDPEAEHVPVR